MWGLPILANIEIKVARRSLYAQKYGAITFLIFQISFGFPVGEKLFYRCSREGAWGVA